MNFSPYHSHWPNTPTSSDAASTILDFASDAHFNPPIQPSLYAASQNSTFAQPQPHTWALGMNHPDWKPKTYTLSNDYSMYDERNYIQPEKRSTTFQSFSPTLRHHTSPDGQIDSQTQPPPYQSFDDQARIVKDAYSDYSERKNPQPHHRNPAQQSFRTYNTAGPHTGTTETMRAVLSQKRPAANGARTAVDRQHRAARRKNGTERRITSPTSSSAEFRFLSPLLEMALQELYPHCKSYRECMESLFRDYCESSPAILSTDISETTSESTFDDELKSVSEEAVSDIEIDLELKSTHVSEKTRTGNPPSSLRAVLLTPNQTEHDGVVTGQLYACPFHQRNPISYESRRLCSGPGWDEVKRVKEHVYRNHLLPIMCLRCSETFETEKELREHSQSEATCPVRKSDREGCSKQQWIEIRSQKDIRSKTGVEKWKGMYRILFPDQKIPSPFFEPRSSYCRRILGNFKDYIVAELPRRIDQDMRSLYLFKKSKSGLMTSVTRHTTELLQMFIEKDQGLYSTTQPERARPRGLTDNYLTTLPPPLGNNPNLPPSAYVVKLPARPARRRADDEPSRSPESSRRVPKRVAREHIDGVQKDS